MTVLLQTEGACLCQSIGWSMAAMLGYSVDALVCDNHKKINSWVSFPSYMSMLPLSADLGVAPELRYRLHFNQVTSYTNRGLCKLK